MNTDPHPLLTCRRLPARVDADGAAVLLGFQPHDMPVLVAGELLKPLGKPGMRCSKWFATVTIEECARDVKWLDKATKCVAAGWQKRNERERQRNGRGNGEQLPTVEDVQAIYEHSK